MPAPSRAQQRLFQVAEHHPNQLYARNRALAALPQATLHEFSSGSERDKPERVRMRRPRSRRRAVRPSGPSALGNRYDVLRRRG